MDELEKFVEDISKATSSPVDFHMAGSYTYDTIIRIRYNPDPRAIGWVFAWASPFKIVSMWCGDDTYHSVEEMIAGINNKRINYVNKDSEV